MVGEMGRIIDDRSLEIVKISPVCWKCKHLVDPDYKTRRCRAFSYIPDEIWTGKHNHQSPYPGDNGIQFEPIEESNDIPQHQD